MNWLAVSVLLVAGGCYGLREAFGVLDRHLQRETEARERQQMADRGVRELARREALEVKRRKVAVLEREMALREKVAEKPDLAEAMPEDLEGRVLAWEDTWAQENERQTITALYAQYKDWDMVRRKLAPLMASVVEIESRPDPMIQ